jgi:hypothetical protein
MPLLGITGPGIWSKIALCTDSDNRSRFSKKFENFVRYEKRKWVLLRLQNMFLQQSKVKHELYPNEPYILEIILQAVHTSKDYVGLSGVFTRVQPKLWISWAVPEDFPSLGAAIEVAEDGDRILVGPGMVVFGKKIHLHCNDFSYVLRGVRGKCDLQQERIDFRPSGAI